MRRVLIAICLAGLWPLAAPRAAVFTTMTPEAIKAAIAYGTAEKTTPAYLVRKSGFVGSVYKPVLGSLSTPFLRVAQAAHDATVLMQPFTEANVTAEMIAPELHVYGFAQADGPRVANVRHIAITTKAGVIQPLRIEPLPVVFKNLYGLTTTGESRLAVFAIDLLQNGHTLHIVYDGPVHDGAINKFCENCGVPLETEKLR